MKLVTITYSSQTTIAPSQGYKWKIFSILASVDAAVSSSSQYFQVFDQVGLRLCSFNETVSSAATYSSYGGYSGSAVSPNPSYITWAYPPECTVTAPLKIGNSLASGTTVTINLLVEEVVDE